MSFRLRRGFNRLFLVLATVWAIGLAVLLPLKLQWDGQQRALIQYREDNKTCDQLVVESPGWTMTKDCYQRATENLQGTLETYSFKNFWVYSVGLWRTLVPLIIMPPLIIYALTALSVWVWRGFNPASNQAQLP